MARICSVCLSVILAGLAAFLMSTQCVLACTGITIKPKDGSIIFARTLEFAVDIKSNVIIVPRGKEHVGSTPTGKPGLLWKTKYGMVGMNAFDKPVIVDGLNEKGLHVGIFYFPDFAKYPEVKAEEIAKTLAAWELGVYLLGTCSDVKEAVAVTKEVRVGQVVQQDLGLVLPLHFIVTDAGGKCAVLEYIAGNLRVYDNPLGVVTNSPSFDWHLTNLSNYVNLTVSNVPKINIGGREWKAVGQGSGMLGLPGDFTPPSRFVRAVFFSKSSLPVDTANEGVLQAFHILNQFDIPKGAARSVERGKELADYTFWTSAADLKNLRYYFRTYDNSRIRMINLKAADLGVKDTKTISLQGKEEIEDVTKTAK